MVRLIFLFDSARSQHVLIPTQLIAHNSFPRIDSNQLITRNDLLEFDSNGLTTQKLSRILIQIDSRLKNFLEY